MKTYTCINGYYKTKVQVDKLLKYMPYASAGVMVYDYDNSIELISYVTHVIRIDCNGWLTCTGTYSQTTRKHISAFLKEYAPHISYYDVKYCYEHNMKINIHTGEIMDIESVVSV